MELTSGSVRVLCLPGCHGAWIRRVVLRAFGGSAVRVDAEVDQDGAADPDSRPTVAVLRYPPDQLVAWFDELCAAESRLDTADRWLSFAPGLAGKWAAFVKRWHVGGRAVGVVDFDDMAEDPRVLIEAVERAAGSGQRAAGSGQRAADLDAAIAEAGPLRPGYYEYFRHYGAGFFRTLRGWFAPAPFVDLERNRLDLCRTVRPIAERVVPDDALACRGAVVILTCTKVGSTAVSAALRRRLAAPVYDIHVLDPGVAVPPREAVKLSAQSRRARATQHDEAARARAAVTDPSVPVRIITAVRDPIAQQVSMFFQLLKQEGGTEAEPDRLVERFEARVDPCWMEYWFGREVSPLAGCEPGALPVDPPRGMGMFTVGDRSFLVLRAEDPAAAKARRLNRFLGTSSVRVQRVHETSSGSASDAYRRFRRCWRPGEALIEAAFSQPIVRLCYSGEELDGMIKRWRS